MAVKFNIFTFCRRHVVAKDFFLDDFPSQFLKQFSTENSNSLIILKDLNLEILFSSICNISFENELKDGIDFTSDEVQDDFDFHKKSLNVAQDLALLDAFKYKVSCENIYLYI